MKLVIQVPCYNEEEALPGTLLCLPREVSGFDVVEWLVIDDGSTDSTVEVAKKYGVHHIVSHTRNQGLARAFATGLETSLKLGADVIVNTDADNQYDARDIPTITAPILESRAGLVIGSRPISNIKTFSWAKRLLQRIGSWVVRIASGTEVEDAPSGFRAMSRELAQKLVVFSDYTYTLETIIQAGQKNLAILSVPIRVTDSFRPSRLVKSTTHYVLRSVLTIGRIFIIYRPFRFFASIGLVSFSIGFLIGLRFLYFYLQGNGDGHLQSLLLAAVLLLIGFQTVLVAFLADLIAANRKLLEDVRYGLASSGADPKILRKVTKSG